MTTTLAGEPLLAHWIGPLGGMVPVAFGTPVSESSPDRYSIRTSLSGRAWAYDTLSGNVATAARTWEAAFPLLDPDDAAVLYDLANGVQSGTAAFVPDTAVRMNVLTPSGFAGAGASSSRAGTMLGADGRTHPSERGEYSGVAPAVPELPVSAAADVSGPSTLSLSLQDASGGTLASTSVEHTEVGTVRLDVSLPATLGAARAVLNVSGDGVQSARHQVAWTGTIPEAYAPPGAASSVIVAAHTLQPRGVYQGRTIYSGTLTIQEVG